MKRCETNENPEQSREFKYKPYTTFIGIKNIYRILFW